MTMREFGLRKKAHDRMKLDEWINQWRQTRWLGFKMIEPYLDKNNSITLFDLMPLPNDPTEAELREAEQQRKAEAKKYTDELVEKFIKSGHIKKK